MSKRIRKVFPNEQVLHLWANQSQSDARGSNVFFKGPIAYSYGYRYKIGKIHYVNGQKLAVINSYNYSMSTNRHLSYARQAVENTPMLLSSNVESIETGLREQFEDLLEQGFNHFKQISFRRGFDLTWFKDKIDSHNKIVELTKLKQFKICFDADFYALMVDHSKLCEARRLEREKKFNTPEEIAKRERIKERKEALEREKLAEKIAAWRQGAPLTYELRKLRPQLIRIRENHVETTNGAHVTLEDAQRMLSKILDKTARPEDRIGSFELAHYNDASVQIGCHTISMSEIRSVFNV